MQMKSNRLDQFSKDDRILQRMLNLTRSRFPSLRETMMISNPVGEGELKKDLLGKEERMVEERVGRLRASAEMEGEKGVLETELGQQTLELNEMSLKIEKLQDQIQTMEEEIAEREKISEAREVEL